MFGRIRSSSSLDSLERPPSKILKDDCLSIYETTLMKLKLGSQHNSSPPTKEDALEDGETDSDSSSSCAGAMKIEAYYNPVSFLKSSHKSASSPEKDLMAVDSDYSTTSTCTTEASEDCQSTEYSRQPRIMNFSILYLFSKFENSRGSPTIMEETMTTEDICCAVVSPSCSASQSIDNVEELSEQESIDSSTALLEKVL